jgi:signal peptidase II
MRARVLPLLIVLTGCVGCDQVSKRAASEWLSGAGPLSYLSDTVRLVYTENHGAFLGLGEHWAAPIRWATFTVFSSLMVLGAVLFALRRLLPAPRGVTRFQLATVLIAAGGMGNLIDRFIRDGAVVDFMNLGVGPLRTGILNVADVQIMLGFGLALLWRPADTPPTTTAW